jgi:zinc transport system ATP-binding protein
MIEPILHVANLHVELNQSQILQNISFDAKEHETIAVIGPNGAGKTTLFRALLGLIPYEGRVSWRPGIKIGYVPQRLYIGNDLPLTTQEFFALKEKNPKEIDRVTSAVRLREDHRTFQKNILKQKLGLLSGGELQKVLIAWALMGHPDVLLFDEPTSGVEISSEGTIYSMVHRLQQEERLTIILISHELQIVYRYATNVICLNKQAICFGSPKEVMDKDSLEKLFGSDVGFYQHHA